MTPSSRDLVIDRIAKSYGDIEILRSVSLTLRPGEAIGLVGPNGAGKSTLLKVVAGFLTPNSGIVEVAGTSSAKGPARRWRAGVSLVFQHSAPIVGLSVVEILHLAEDGARRERRPVVLGASAVIAALRLESARESQLSRLDAAVAKRVHAARAYLTGARFLLMDELFAGQDDRDGPAITAWLESCCHEGRGLLLADHEIAFLRTSCDRIAFMDQGTVALVGTPAEVFADPTVRRHYLD